MSDTGRSILRRAAVSVGDHVNPVALEGPNIHEVKQAGLLTYRDHCPLIARLQVAPRR